MKRINIFTKTFATILSLMLGGILIAYVILYNLIPHFYKNYKSSQMDREIQTVCSNTELTIPVLKQELSSLADEYNLNAVIHDSSDEVIFDVATLNSFHYYSVDEAFNSDFESDEIVLDSEYEIENYAAYSNDENENFLEKKYDVTIEGENFRIVMQLPLQPLDESRHVLIMIFPISAAICLVLSLLGSYFFARYITKPIKNMAAAAARMAQLNPEEFITIKRHDEIGELSDSINAMYESLMQAISELEQKIKEVQKSEANKIDFLRTASHELKTPLSSVNALLEGMLYNVPPYDDRDTYIRQCQEILATANILIKNTLDLSNESTEITNIRLKTVVEEQVQLISLIARQRKVKLKLNIPDNVQISTRMDSLKKAMMNIISNAVKFSEKNQEVDIDYENGILTVFNPCKPLSANEAKAVFEPFRRILSTDDSESIGNGLGMCIIERALKICDIDFRFEPSKNQDGMMFVCDLSNVLYD